MADNPVTSSYDGIICPYDGKMHGDDEAKPLRQLWEWLECIDPKCGRQFAARVTSNGLYVAVPIEPVLNH